METAMNPTAVIAPEIALNLQRMAWPRFQG